MIESVYQIKITLEGSKPQIWRKILVKPMTTLSDFHRIIQTTMGWSNSHHHRFYKDKIYYSPFPADFKSYWITYPYFTFDYNIENTLVFTLLKYEKESLFYEYDYNASWSHRLVLEKILPHDPKHQYPLCIGGKRSSPPEDCEGIKKYNRILKIIKQPNHKEYESIIKWLGTSFDPDYFDLQEINERLSFKNYGCVGE